MCHKQQLEVSRPCIDSWCDIDQKRIEIDGESCTYPRSSAISVSTLTHVALMVGSSGNSILKSEIARTSERAEYQHWTGHHPELGYLLSITANHGRNSAIALMKTYGSRDLCEKKRIIAEMTDRRLSEHTHTEDPLPACTCWHTRILGSYSEA